MPDDKKKEQEKNKDQAAKGQVTGKPEANQELSDEQLGKVAGGGKYDLSGKGYGGGGGGGG